MILALVLAMFVLYLLADRLQVLGALINGRLALPGRSGHEFILEGLSARFVSGSIIALCLIVSAFVAVAGLRLVKTNGKGRSASDPKGGNDKQRV